MWKPDLCLYHFPCDDGFASAWVVRRKWPDCVLAPTNYGLAFPDIDIVGRNLLIADFSYRADVLADLAKKAKSIIILDHHKTAEADLCHLAQLNCSADDERLVAGLTPLVALGNVAARFDMVHSGAALTWEFCFLDQPMPQLLAHIEDRDLWRMALPDTRKVSLLLRSYPYDFALWDDLIEMFEANASGLLGEAHAIERFYDCKIAEMLPTATLKAIGKWKDVPVAHAPYAFASDLAHELLKAYPAAPFAAVVVDAYGGRTYSLRSEDSRQDVSEVAKTFGGGGHRNAAGFRVPL